MPGYRDLIVLLCPFLLTACSDEPATERPKEKSGHVWQGQTDMLNEAKRVGQEVNELQLQKEERLNQMEKEME